MKTAILLSSLAFFALFIGPKLLAMVEALHSVAGALN